MKAEKRRSSPARRSKQADPPLIGFIAPLPLPGAVSWIRYLTRLQNETFYFLHALSSRLVETNRRFAACRKFEDVIDAHTTLVGDLLEDFAEEGALMATLLCEPAAEAKAGAIQRSGETSRRAPTN